MVVLSSSTRFRLTPKSDFPDRELERIWIEEKLSYFYSWSQPYQNRFHTEVHQLLAAGPKEDYLIQLGFLLSDLIFQAQNDLLLTLNYQNVHS